MEDTIYIHTLQYTHQVLLHVWSLFLFKLKTIWSNKNHWKQAVACAHSYHLWNMSGPLYPTPNVLWAFIAASLTSHFSVGCSCAHKGWVNICGDMSTSTGVNSKLTKYSIQVLSGPGSLVALRVSRVGGERICAEGYTKISDLTLTTLRAEKGRGIPVISKLRRSLRRLPAALIYKYN